MTPATSHPSIDIERLAMNSLLDDFHDLLLHRVCNDGGLTIELKCLDEAGRLQSMASIRFEKVSLHLVVEEALDAYCSSAPEDGWIYIFGVDDQLRSGLHVDVFPFYRALKHFGVYSRNEVVHVFASGAPSIELTALPRETS
jgi:hypothetical protein